MNRQTALILCVVIATSLVWFLVDVCLLMYFTDCISSVRDAQPIECLTPIHSVDSDRRLPLATPTAGELIDKCFSQPRPWPPGDCGLAVIIPKEREDESKELFKINQFNLIASDIMSLNRTLRDYRPKACRNKTYEVSKLLNTSIVIVFHNEAWSTLLRTLWSIINKSPCQLVHEIILVDDASEMDFLGKQLDEYVATLPIHTYVFRMGQRSGLVKARLRGAELSKGQAITFLDAHCECTEGWLEPLLHEIYLDRSTVISPVIDTINDDTFEYIPIPHKHMIFGGFNWNVEFQWHPEPEHEKERRHGDITLPLRSPTMAGGLFSIHKEYFYEIGSYDEGMSIWGKENIEMSLRVWMCGGKVLISPCSRVGHVFRKVSPYTWPGGEQNIINRNTRRTVEVWMDNYQEFFYKVNPSARETPLGDITDRKKLRERLKCNSFQWYLTNIYPESPIPVDFYSLGQIVNKETRQCLDNTAHKAGEEIGLLPCHGFGHNEVFSYTAKKELRTHEFCLDTNNETALVPVLQNCHGQGGSQRWIYDNKTSALRHATSNLCLDKSTTPAYPYRPSLAACSGGQSQQWELESFEVVKYLASYIKETTAND